MNAEIIAVGSELLTPQRLDTNSLFLTEQLNELGIEVVTKTVVGDDRERLGRAERAGGHPLRRRAPGRGLTRRFPRRTRACAGSGVWSGREHLRNMRFFA